MAKHDTPPNSATTKQPGAQRVQRTRLGPVPASEDAKGIEAEPPAEKRDKSKKASRGTATTTPKAKPQKGK